MLKTPVSKDGIDLMGCNAPREIIVKLTINDNFVLQRIFQEYTQITRKRSHVEKEKNLVFKNLKDICFNSSFWRGLTHCGYVLDKIYYEKSKRKSRKKPQVVLHFQRFRGNSLEGKKIAGTFKELTSQIWKSATMWHSYMNKTDTICLISLIGYEDEDMKTQPQNDLLVADYTILCEPY